MAIRMAWLIRPINKRTFLILLMAKDQIIKLPICKCKIYHSLLLKLKWIILKIKINKIKVSQVLIYPKLKVHWVVLLIQVVKVSQNIPLPVLLILEAQIYQCLMQDHRLLKKCKEMPCVMLVGIGTFHRQWVMMNYLLAKLCPKKILMLQNFHLMVVR